jgi:hypothetical protein
MLSDQEARLCNRVITDIARRPWLWSIVTGA